MGEKNNISSSEDSSEEELDDFEEIWESHQIESRRPEEATEAAPEADVQSSPIDTEVYSVNPESAVETTFPQTDFR